MELDETESEMDLTIETCGCTGVEFIVPVRDSNPKLRTQQADDPGSKRKGKRKKQFTYVSSEAENGEIICTTCTKKKEKDVPHRCD